MNFDGGEIKSKALVTDEGRISAELSRLPTPEVMKQMAAAVAVHAARNILLGNLPFKSAGEASKVARDFAAIAKDFSFDNESEELKKAETLEDRMDAFAEFKKRAEENMK